MAQIYFAILTAIGEAKLANAIALGTTLQLTKMAVGDGNGATPIPNRNQTALVHENRRAPLNTLFVDPANASQIVAEQIIPEDIGGWWIRELGLYDAAGDLCAVANCPDTYKPVLASGSGRTQIIRMVLIVANTSAVELKIDPSVVLAPRGYVDQVMAVHAAAADPHPQYATDADIAAHNAAADPHPQYLTSAEGDAKVAAAVAALVASSPASLDTLDELAAALGDDPNFAATIINALAGKAPLASPTLTGAPTAPTAVPGTNDTQLANMAALQTAVQSAAAITSNAGGTADAITGSYTPAITTLTNGMPLLVRAASANTAATPTFTPNNGTIAAKPIVKGAGAALVAGDIAGAGHWLELQYDQTLDKWVLLNPATGISSGSGKIIASLFTATRAVVAASGDSTVMTLNFTLAQATPVVVDWRAWFSQNSSSLCYGDARLMLGATQKSRSSRIHLGNAATGYAYTYPFNGSTYLGVLAAGSYTISLIWNNQTATGAVFNPGTADSSVWSQADSEIIVRAAY